MDAAVMRTIRRCSALLAIGAALTLATGCARKEPAQGRTPVPIVTPAPNATGMIATGSPAITPPSNGPITDAQVRSYVLSHRVRHALRSTNVAVSSITFMSSAQVSALLHSAKLAVPDQQMMCLVIMTGTFVFPGPPGVTPTFPIGVEVFDARTGDLLQSGGLPRPPRPQAPG